MTYKLLEPGEIVQEGDQFLVVIHLSNGGSDRVWQSFRDFIGIAVDDKHVVRRAYDDEESDLKHEIRHMGEDADTHREEYDKRSNGSMITSASAEYWRGRRDEAGYFRDRLFKLL